MNQGDLFKEGEGDTYFRRNTAAKLSPQVSERLDALLTNLPLTPTKILEIGCSNGLCLEYLRRHTGAECHGIDLSKDAVMSGSNAFPDLKLQVADAADLPYPIETFDCVLFGFCLCWLAPETLFRVAAEADRVLKPGGALVIIDFDVPYSYRNTYKHKEGIYSYKSHWRDMFLWHPSYSLVSVQATSIQAHRFRVEVDERMTCSILYKAELDDPRAFLTNPFQLQSCHSEQKLTFEHGQRFSRHKDLDAYIASGTTPEYADYRKRWIATMSEETLPDATPPAPYFISISTTDLCNLACSFCYRHSPLFQPLQRKPMRLELFSALIAEMNDIGVDSFEITGGEGLIHPQIEEILNVAKQSTAQDRFLATNGLLLQGDLLDKALDVFTRVSISIDAASENVYRSIRGGDYDQVLRNIDAFIERKEKRKITKPIFRVTFIVMNENRHELQNFIEKWRPIADVVDIQDLIHYPESAQVIPMDESSDFSYCPDPFRMLSVSANGSVYPCCSVYGRCFSLGTFPEASLSSIWRGETMRQLRDDLRNKRPSQICRNCRSRTR